MSKAILHQLTTLLALQLAVNGIYSEIIITGFHQKAGIKVNECNKYIKKPKTSYAQPELKKTTLKGG